MMHYFLKMAGKGVSPPRPALNYIILSWIGSALAIGAVAFLTQVMQTPYMFAPLGASAVLAFAVHESPLAQPRNIIGGHVITASVGVIFLMLFGADWWVMGLAVATAIAAMQVAKMVHPPAGANPIIVLITASGWDFVGQTVLPGAVILTLCALLFNNIHSLRRYPTYWW